MRDVELEQLAADLPFVAGPLSERERQRLFRLTATTQQLALDDLAAHRRNRDQERARTVEDYERLIVAKYGPFHALDSENRPRYFANEMDARTQRRWTA